MMRNKLFLVTAAVASMTLVARAADAQVTSSFAPGVMGIQAGETLFDDFEGGMPDPHFTYTGDVGIYQGLTPGIAAPPAGDSSHYLAVLGGGTATFDFGQAYHSFSMDVGSVDSYNSLVITLFGSSGSVTLTGSQLNAGNSANGDQSNPLENGRLTLTSWFGITGFTATSSGNSFEFDNIGVAGPVPEPTAWALMFAGFGAIGGALRSQRRKTNIIFA